MSDSERYRDDVEADVERGIWDEDPGGVRGCGCGRGAPEAGEVVHTVTSAPEPWRRTIVWSLWEALAGLGALALWFGLSGFVSEPSGPSDGVTVAQLHALAWRILGIYLVTAVAVVALRRLYPPRVCRVSGAKVRS